MTENPYDVISKLKKEITAEMEQTAKLRAALVAIVKVTDGTQPKDYPAVLMIAQFALKGE